MAAQPGYVSYLSASHFLNFGFKTHPVNSKLGTHYGAPFSQKLSLFMTEQEYFPGYQTGMFYFYKRLGWQTKDFLIQRDGEDSYAFGYSSHAWALYLSKPQKNWSVALGSVWENYLYKSDLILDHSDNKYNIWAFSKFWLMGAQALFKEDIKYFNLEFNLQSRNVRDLYHGLGEFFPDISFSYRNGNAMQWTVSIEQNIALQQLYLYYYDDVENWDKQAFVLRWYEPTRFMYIDYSLHFMKDNKVRNGFQIKIPFFRMAYNHAEDYLKWNGMSGKWVFEVQFDIGTKEGVFGLGAPVYKEMSDAEAQGI